MHIGSDSVFVSKHHTNWRIRAIDSLDRKAHDDLHYSSVISLSVKDVEKIREVFLRSIERVDEIMKPSPEETAYCVLLDFFKV